MAPALKNRIIFVCGRLCSGKDTFADNLAFHEKITVSDIVKQITGEIARAKLQDTANLDKLIATELLNKIRTGNQYAIVGMRQLSILREMEKELDPNEYELVWLLCPTKIRKQRFLTRGDVKDSQITFEQADENDAKLGLEELRKRFWFKMKMHILKHY